MTDSIDPPPRRLKPTLQKPLLGLTILAVEDSRFASEAIRQLCLRSGARIRRADCLRAARRHLSVYLPSVVLADIGLPDGSGLDLLASRPREPDGQPAMPVIAMSGDPGERAAALAAGADRFIAKPIEGLGAFQELILGCLPAEWRPAGPRPVADSLPALDPLTLREDLEAASIQLAKAEGAGSVSYVARFLEGVGRIAADGSLEGAARTLRESSDDPGEPAMADAVAQMQTVLARRIGALSQF